jgi:hypothetical protein
MKRWLIAWFFLLALAASGCSPAAPCGDDPACLRVLFIGNSYTYVNDLPATFAKLAQSGGQRVETGMAAPGGWSLSDHVKSTETLDQIKSSKWNFVVLQEQSQIPASEQMRARDVYPAARSLSAKIKAAGATPVFFVTWAHKDGWPDIGLVTYESMQLQINQGYVEIADELDALVAPVGFAWLKLWKQNPQLVLWQADGSHPNEKGTYLAACVFYATLYRQSPEGLGYTSTLSNEEARLLQKIAADTVLKEPLRWNLP